MVDQRRTMPSTCSLTATARISPTETGLNRAGPGAMARAWTACAHALARLRPRAPSR